MKFRNHHYLKLILNYGKRYIILSTFIILHTNVYSQDHGINFFHFPQILHSSLESFLNTKTSIKNFSIKEVDLVETGNARIENYPWTGLLLKTEGNKNCSVIFIQPHLDTTGKIIDWKGNFANPGWALTAAHCLYGENLNKWVIIAGTDQFIHSSELPMLKKGIECLKHQDYKSCRLNNVDPKFNHICSKVIEIVNGDKKSLKIIRSKFCQKDLRMIYFNKQNVFIHNEYSPITFENDIALIKLNRFDASNTNKISSITIANTAQLHVIERHEPTAVFPERVNKDFSEDNVQVYVAGWGSEGEGKPKFSSNLKFSKLPYQNHYKCKTKYQSWGFDLSQNVMCYGELNSNEDTCYGDSGSAIVYKRNEDYYSSSESIRTLIDQNIQTYNNILVGIVSFGIGCDQKKLVSKIFSVATKVTAFSRWITNSVQCNSKRINIHQFPECRLN